MGVRRVLLTGAGGAIGIHVLAHFLENTDWEIVGTDSFRHRGHFDRIDWVCRQHPGSHERVTIITHDLTAPFTNREIERIGSIDYIINLASLVVVGDSVDDPEPFIRNNIEIALQTLALARTLKPEVFIQFSTDEVYGSAPVDSVGHKEWAPIVPSN